MNDSLVELAYLVYQFEKYGTPGTAMKPGRQQDKNESSARRIETDKITLAWMRDHVPASLWASAAAVCVAAFVAGFLAGRNVFFRKGYELIRETFTTEVRGH
jgi:hypothetical protein